MSEARTFSRTPTGPLVAVTLVREDTWEDVQVDEAQDLAIDAPLFEARYHLPGQEPRVGLVRGLFQRAVEDERFDVASSVQRKG